MMANDGRERGSFRDPMGFVYRKDGRLLRQLQPAAQPVWEPFIASGLCAALQDDGLLVGHEEVSTDLAHTSGAWKVIAPTELPFISFPYEWSVRQLVDAALLTLDVQERAIRHGMVLRDASAYNVQLHRGRPIFIDSLSFGPWEEGAPWVAYAQFCRHFLAPLALSRHVAPGLRALLRSSLDGIPLTLASRTLPASTWLRPGLVSHLHLHARATERYADAATPSSAAAAAPPARSGAVSKTAMLGMIDSLRGTVTRCDITPSGTEWGAYYDATNYTDAATESKVAVVREALDAALDDDPARMVWDLGANTGRYSRVAAERADTVIAFDVDEAAVDLHWRTLARAPDAPPVLPLLSDLTNPSPSLGWAHAERPSLTARGPADAILALALIHHLAISNNTPLPEIARWFAQLGRGAVVEWVPKEDSQVRRLLATREDVFPDYTREGFEAAFGAHFTIERVLPVAESERIVYALRRRAGDGG